MGLSIPGELAPTMGISLPPTFHLASTHAAVVGSEQHPRLTLGITATAVMMCSGLLPFLPDLAPEDGTVWALLTFTTSPSLDELGEEDALGRVSSGWNRLC